MLISDQLWYWSHRLMHTPWFWRNWHVMHHVAPQCALSATYVHPGEYMLFCLAMQLPFALTGFPVWVYVVPMGWGMLTGGGAHSGYGGDFANGEKHGTGHHLYHSANFGLLMTADMMWGEYSTLPNISPPPASCLPSSPLLGTHWSPGEAPPRRFKLGESIESKFSTVKGKDAHEAVEALLSARKLS
jgi:hypothetical protein